MPTSTHKSCSLSYKLTFFHYKSIFYAHHRFTRCSLLLVSLTQHKCFIRKRPRRFVLSANFHPHSIYLHWLVHTTRCWLICCVRTADACRVEIWWEIAEIRPVADFTRTDLRIKIWNFCFQVEIFISKVLSNFLENELRLQVNSKINCLHRVMEKFNHEMIAGAAIRHSQFISQLVLIVECSHVCWFRKSSWLVQEDLIKIFFANTRESKRNHGK